MLAMPMTPTAPHLQAQIDHAGTPVDGSTYDNPSTPPGPSSTMLSAISQTPPNKKPKLSLQTASLPVTFGKSSTAHAITASALPTASPTCLNTFSNAYDVPHRPSPNAPSPAANRSARPPSRLASPFISHKDERPYKLPLGLKGILRNSSLPSSLRGASSCASPRTSRRVFFPAVKKVGYRYPLEEEIKTVTYVARHSDISSESGTDCASESSSSDDESDETFQTDSTDASDVSLPVSRKRRKHQHNRQVKAAAMHDGILCGKGTDERSRPKHSHRKRRRQWVWTLGPVEEGNRESEKVAVEEVFTTHSSKPELSLDTTSSISADWSEVCMPREKTPFPFSDGDERRLFPFQIPLPPSTSSSPASSSSRSSSITPPTSSPEKASEL